MASIPSTYETSRDRFRASLTSFLDLWPAARLTSTPLADAPDLTIDVVCADAIRARQRLLFLTTGLHGIEGYVGSGILQLFTDEFLPRLDPATTGIVAVHPINPYGMKHRTRYNKNNVDLNRNFNPDFESLKSINPHYESLAFLINPARPLKHPLYEKPAFLWNVAKALPRGVTLIRETSLMGQYRLDEGLYFGGFEAQEETRQLMSLFRNSIPGYAQILALDIHSGYGPRWQLTLVNPSLEKKTSEETAARFNVPHVAGGNPEEFYTIHGEMGDFMLQALESDSPSAKIYAGAFEFGTFGESLWQGIRSLRAIVLENCLRWSGGSEAARRWVGREFDELYQPSEARWWQKAQANARQYFNGILAAEGFLH